MAIRFLIELDGPILDVRPQYLAAYAQVAKDLGTARVDDSSFWRLLRSAAMPAEFLRYATAKQIESYQALFEAAVEVDDCVRKAIAHDDITGQLQRLGKPEHRVLISTRANRNARQQCIDDQGLSTLFWESSALPQEQSKWSAKLSELRGDNARTVVCASTDKLIRAAEQANLITAGIACGTCTKQRLNQAGAAVVFNDLEELADDIEQGAKQLVAAGLLPNYK